MNVDIIDIKEKNILQKERIVLKALTNLNIGDFIVFLTEKITEDRFSIIPKEIYWFQDKDIKKGDFVVLYSKTGKNSEKLINNGLNKTHFFYQNLDQPYFSEEKNIALVIEASDWVIK